MRDRYTALKINVGADSGRFDAPRRRVYIFIVYGGGNRLMRDCPCLYKILSSTAEAIASRAIVHYYMKLYRVDRGKVQANTPAEITGAM